MPPKVKVTKEMILDSVLNITRKAGFENVNARSIAKELNCSTRPIFTCYQNMEELKKEFLNFAFEFYNRYTANFNNNIRINPYLLFPVSYIEFAKDETHMFKLLFISEIDLNMTKAKDFYNERDNEEKAKNFAEEIGIDLEHAKSIFLDLFLYSHGIAVLTAAKKISFDIQNSEKMVLNILTALINKEKSDCETEI